mmetsp:Transcript_85133/g.194163  ORF Transcript_85133/g.194163 Transcript_85133/m.194163 type:complete len:267 (-) Transcript_85133:1663-2463(-)
MHRHQHKDHIGNLGENSSERPRPGRQMGDQPRETPHTERRPMPVQRHRRIQANRRRRQVHAHEDQHRRGHQRRALGARPPGGVGVELVHRPRFAQEQGRAVEGYAGDAPEQVQARAPVPLVVVQAQVPEGQRPHGGNHEDGEPDLPVGSQDHGDAVPAGPGVREGDADAEGGADVLDHEDVDQGELAGLVQQEEHAPAPPAGEPGLAHAPPGADSPELDVGENAGENGDHVGEPPDAGVTVQQLDVVEQAVDHHLVDFRGRLGPRG